jgi:hypothetical protein
MCLPVRRTQTGKKGTSMSNHKKTGLSRVVLAAIVFAAVAFAPASGPSAWAGSKVSARTQIDYTGETPVYPGYPQAFHLVGRINRISAGEVVIDDSLYRISAVAAYHTPGHSNTLQSELHVDDVVGCLRHADGEIESIWFITRGAR